MFKSSILFLLSQLQFFPQRGLINFASARNTEATLNVQNPSCLWTTLYPYYEYYEFKIFPTSTNFGVDYTKRYLLFGGAFNAQR